MILLKQATRYEYDVFIGSGWDNHIRVRRNHWGLTANAPIDKAFSLKLAKLIAQHPHGSIDPLVCDNT